MTNLEQYLQLKFSMKNLFLMSLITFMLFPSCQENKVYNAFLDKRGKKVVQLVKKNDIDKTAYLAMFQYSNEDSILKMSKDIAQYYNIEGYDMFFNDSIQYFISEELKEWENFDESTVFNAYARLHITPYQYRMSYVSGSDTIAKIIKRSEFNGRKAAILTNKRYNRKDTVLLKEAIQFLNIDEAYIFDSIPSKVYVINDDLINAYSYYRDFNNQFFFWNEAAKEDKFFINGAHVRNVRDDKLFTKYWTNRFLTSKEILKIKQEKQSAKWKNVVYFYIPYEYNKDYASIHYNKEKKEYTIFMFNRVYIE